MLCDLDVTTFNQMHRHYSIRLTLMSLCLILYHYTMINGVILAGPGR